MIIKIYKMNKKFKKNKKFIKKKFKLFKIKLKRKRY